MKVPLYRVRRWDEIYENNRSRELVSLDWIPVPNNHDGDGYTYMMSQRRCVSYFAAWNWIIQVASKCEPRGTLIRKTGKPHTAESMARLSRAPVSIFAPALEFFATGEIAWLEIVDHIEDNEKTQQGAMFSQEGVSEGKGREGKGREEKSRIIKSVVEYLNEKIGSKYRPEAKDTVKKIGGRLDEGFTYEDCIKVIDTKVAEWKGDPKMEKFLRPETLFRASKFEGYLNQGAPVSDRQKRIEELKRLKGGK
jgi:uncharacterized phage protein (TIGR02220 family)